MFLNKVKIGMLIGVVLTLLRAFLPDVSIPEDLQNALVLVVVFVAQFFVRETQTTVNGLRLKK